MAPFFTTQMFIQIVLLTMMGTLAFSRDGRHSTIHIMVLFSTQGSYANVSDYRTVFPHWQQYVNDKYDNDVTWPFNISLEHTDVQSNISFINIIMEQRLSSTTLPGNIISCIMFDARFL
jgi:hypothetical protein